MLNKIYQVGHKVVDHNDITVTVDDDEIVWLHFSTTEKVLSIRAGVLHKVVGDLGGFEDWIRTMLENVK